MRLVPLLLVLAACRDDGGGSRKVGVIAFAGTHEEPGVRVVGHTPAGATIDEVTTDGTGYASVGVDDDSLVSVVFEAGKISVVTTPVPATGDIIVYGPPHVTAPLVVGVLQVNGPPLSISYDIEIGCAVIQVNELPATVDVTSCSMGSDRELDVLVRGYDVSRNRIGYAASRVPMVDGIADFSIASWEMVTPAIDFTLDGVSPMVDLTFLCDGLPFASDVLAAWTGLVVDTSRVTATIDELNGARIMQRDLAGVPAMIQIGGADFMPSIAQASRQGSSFTWDAANLGDAVDLRAVWDAQRTVVWDAVLPPDATTVTVPEAVPAITNADVMLRYVDSANLEGFSALVAAGIHAEDTMRASTIAPRAAGELRISESIGLR